MSMIRRVMIESCSIRVIMKSRKSWFKTMAEVREFSVSMGGGVDESTVRM